MKEAGLLVKTDNNKATVKVDKKDECSKCGMCLFHKNASSVEFTVVNDVGAKEGDTVLIEMNSNSKLLGAVLAFFVPLLLIFISAIVTFAVIGEEIYMLVLSVGLVVIWYLILPIIDKRLKTWDKFCPKVIKVLKESEEEKTLSLEDNK